VPGPQSCRAAGRRSPLSAIAPHGAASRRALQLSRGAAHGACAAGLAGDPATLRARFAGSAFRRPAPAMAIEHARERGARQAIANHGTRSGAARRCPSCRKCRGPNDDGRSTSDGRGRGCWPDPEKLRVGGREFRNYEDGARRFCGGVAAPLPHCWLRLSTSPSARVYSRPRESWPLFSGGPGRAPAPPLAAGRAS
jgi:hypothetical protein